MNVYPFIEAEKAQQRNVKRACELLEVSRAAYYAHRAGVPSARQLADDRAHRAHPPGPPGVQGPLRRPTHPRRAASRAATGTAASGWPG